MERSFKPWIESRLGNMKQFEWDMLQTFISRFNIPKGQRINCGTDFCHYIWLLEDGAVKAVEGNEDEVVDLFLPGMFFTDVLSLSLHKRTSLSFIPTSDTVLHQLDFGALVAASEKSLFLANVSRLIMESQMLRETETRRIVGQLLAEERIQSLYDRSPELFLSFSLKDISRFIGITPESLSRVRRKMAS